MNPKIDFDSFAHQYDEQRKGYIPYINSLTNLITQSKANAIIDIGCGTGSILQLLSLEQVKIKIGLDISKNMLEVAKSKDYDSMYILASATSTPFPNSFFNGIISIYLVHLIDEKERFFYECYRILKEEGWLFLVSAPHFFIQAHPLNKFFPSFSKIDISRFPSEIEIEEMLKHSGFRKIKRCYYIVFRNWYSKEYFQKIKSKFISTLQLISTVEFELGLELMGKIIKSGTIHPPLPWISVAFIALKD